MGEATRDKGNRVTWGFMSCLGGYLAGLGGTGHVIPPTPAGPQYSHLYREGCWQLNWLLRFLLRLPSLSW